MQLKPILLGTLLLACSRASVPCDATKVCAAGQECLANRCREAGSSPVEQDSVRYLSESLQLVQLSAEGPLDVSAALSIRLGSEQLGPSLLLLNFGQTWRNLAEVESAFLLLDPVPSGPRTEASLELEVWTLSAAWQEESLSWQRQPTLSYPVSTAVSHASVAVLRIDVTEHLRHALRHPEHHHGLAVRSYDLSGTGRGYSTGLSGGVAPRLEVYGRPASRPEPGSARETG